MTRRRKTKIICTYGPSIANPEILKQAILAGANIIRFNFSHGDYDYHRDGMNKVRQIREELGKSVAILLDTKGPEIRTGSEQPDGPLTLNKDETITLCFNSNINTKESISIDYPGLYQEVNLQQKILIDDGKLAVQVIDKSEKGLECKVLRGGTINARRGINVPELNLSMPFLSERDRSDLDFGAEVGVDIIAASFTRTAEDIKSLRSHLYQNHQFTCDIVAKIENHQGVENIEEICQVADGIMIARGDLGVELPVEDVPSLQKKIIQLCRKVGKPVITATQMLESMVEHARPTRAEVSDVANAIYDATSAIMLSGETASGQYPIECIQMMDTIALQTESETTILPDEKLFEYDAPIETTKSMADAALQTAKNLQADAIVSLTSSGHAARMVSRLRPPMRLIAATVNSRTYYKMALYWGVEPVLMQEHYDTLGELFNYTLNLLDNRNFLNPGDLAILLGGSPVGTAGSTNVLRVSPIGSVAVRGHGLVKHEAEAHAHLFKGKENTPDGRIIVMRYLLEEDLCILNRAKGLILQSDTGADIARIAGEALKIPVITCAEGCYNVIKENEVLNVDGQKGMAYRKYAHPTSLSEEFDTEEE